MYDQFKAFRVLDQKLAAVPSTKGISCTKNPSERRCGRIRFNEIIQDISAVAAMLDRMEVYFARNDCVSVAVMLELFGKSCIYTSNRAYKNIRCCRILAEAPGKRCKDCVEDFEVFKRMSRGVYESV